MKNIWFLFIIVPTMAIAQYTPEVDVSGKSDAKDGAELQLATPSKTNFLRLFSGRTEDPNPYIYYNQADKLSIATGDQFFGSFEAKVIIDGNGEVTITNLSGAGTQSIEVDANGELKRSGFKHFSIPSSAFKPNKWDPSEVFLADYFSAYFITPSSHIINAPVYLPDNCLVTKVTIEYIDNDAINDADLILWENNNGLFTEMASTTTSGASTSTQSTTINAVFNIDNENASYTFAMQPTAPGSMDVDFQMIRVLIQYIQ